MTVLDETRLEAFIGQAVRDLAAAESAAACYLGDRLGFYRHLRHRGPVTATELAEATGTNPRLVLEWLRNQVAGGYLEHLDEGEAFVLPDEQAAVLADESAPVFMAGIFDIIASIWADVDAVEAAFRGDGGLSWGHHDSRLYRGVERLFAPAYRSQLVSAWLPALEGVVDVLAAGGRVADVGCGHGVSSIVIAEAFPNASVAGYDCHGPSIDAARKAASEAGLDGRVRFETADATGLPEGVFDLVCFFDCLHDMGDPVGAASAARRALVESGTLLVVEPMAGDRLSDNTNPVSRLYYAGSVFLCTPSALSQDGGRALGAQAGPAAISGVLREAGFSRVRVAAEAPFNLVLEARP